jgi:uncharacterized protein (TIGR03083 family)
MEAEMTKAQFLDLLRVSRAEWDALLARVPEDRMSAPGVAGGWSVKDVIAHITWHEREMLGVLQAHALVGSDLWDLPLDERNAIIYAQNRDRPLAEVLAESRAVYPQLLAAAQALTEADLTDPGRFANMPGDWVPWQLLAENTYTHYRDHIPAMRAWLEQESGPGAARISGAG